MSFSSLALALLGYVGLLVLALAVLAAAKRGDEAMTRVAEKQEDGPLARVPDGRPAITIEAASDPARQLAADVVGALGVERVVVLLQRPEGCSVAAAGGVPGVVGQHVPMGAGADGTEGARVLLRRSAWQGVPLSVASVPIESGGRPIGAVAIAMRRLSARDLDFLRRMVARAGRNMPSAELDAV